MEKKGEENVEFNWVGEAISCISLDQARVLAMRTDSAEPGDHGPEFGDARMAARSPRSTRHKTTT